MHKVCSHRARDGRKRQTTLPGICRAQEQHFELLPKKTNCYWVLGVLGMSGSAEEADLYCQKDEQPHAEWQEHQWACPTFGVSADFVSAGERS